MMLLQKLIRRSLLWCVLATCLCVQSVQARLLYFSTDTSYQWVQSFAKSNCPTGYIAGDSFDYVVLTKEFMDTNLLSLPTHYYSSVAHLSEEGQAYADKQGTCVRKCRSFGEQIQYTDDACCDGYFVRLQNNTKTCSLPYWEVSSWNKSCGTANRDVYCVGKDGVRLSDNACTNSKPVQQTYLGKCNGEKANMASECASQRIVTMPKVWTNRKCGGGFDACPADYDMDLSQSRFSDGQCDCNFLFCSHTYTYTYCVKTKNESICVAPNYGENCSTGCENVGATIGADGKCTNGMNNCYDNDEYYIPYHSNYIGPKR